MLTSGMVVMIALGSGSFVVKSTGYLQLAIEKLQQKSLTRPLSCLRLLQRDLCLPRRACGRLEDRGKHEIKARDGLIS